MVVPLVVDAAVGAVAGSGPVRLGEDPPPTPERTRAQARCRADSKSEAPTGGAAGSGAAACRPRRVVPLADVLPPLTLDSRGCARLEANWTAAGRHR